MGIFKSISIFVFAGLCEIGGGYLLWLWLKEGKPLWYGIIGGIILALYGVVATWQTANFGRVYATYGGVFIVLALFWAWKVDGFKPDKLACHLRNRPFFDNKHIRFLNGRFSIIHLFPTYRQRRLAFLAGRNHKRTNYHLPYF